MPENIQEAIHRADNLPSLPTVALQILKMTNSEDISVNEIAKVIQQDPALTSKILRVVNSSLFGMSRKISSLSQAMVVLGLRSVKVMVLSFSLVDVIPKGSTRRFDYEGYWRRSLTTAVTSRLLTERIHRNVADEAFVAGLLCDIGILAAVHCASEFYGPVIDAYAKSEGTYQVCEQKILGLTHEQITADLLQHWGLPEELHKATASHHHPLGINDENNICTGNLTNILRSAATMADLFVGDTKADQIEEAKQAVAKTLNLTNPVVTKILEEIDKNVCEAATLFDLSIGQTMSYQEIQMAALGRLAQLSMVAELERAQTAKREEEAQRKVKELHEENLELTQKATIDVLTGIANRAKFENELAKAWKVWKSEQVPIGLIMIDLDHFKHLNDTYGHQGGDEALRTTGKILRNQATEACIPARYGGEEFVMVTVGLSSRALQAFAEEIRLEIAKSQTFYDKKVLTFTASLGTAHLAAGISGLTSHILIESVDRCLYEAKRNGRNRVVSCKIDETSIIGAPHPVETA